MQLSRRADGHGQLAQLLCVSRCARRCHEEVAALRIPGAERLAGCDIDGVHLVAPVRQDKPAESAVLDVDLLHVTGGAEIVAGRVGERDGSSMSKVRATSRAGVDAVFR